jgi:hypothetical protein
MKKPQRRISQREARKLRERVKQLERAEDERRRNWSQTWSGGVELTRVTWKEAKDEVPLVIRMARRLGHAVVAVGDETGCIKFIALPHPILDN